MFKLRRDSGNSSSMLDLSLFFNKLGAKKSYNDHLTNKLKEFNYYSSLILSILNALIVLIVNLLYCFFQINHKILPLLINLSSVSFILSISTVIISRTNVFKDEKTILANSIFISFLITMPFQVFSGLLTTLSNYLSDPALLVVTIEIIIRFMIISFFNSSWRINLTSSIISISYLWLSLIFYFHSKTPTQVYFYLVINTLFHICLVSFSYFYEEIISENFEVYSSFKSERAYFLQLFSEMNNGFLIFQDGEVKLYNIFIMNLASKFHQISNTDVSNLTKKENIANFINQAFRNFESVNPDLPDKVSILFKKSSKIKTFGDDSFSRNDSSNDSDSSGTLEEFKEPINLGIFENLLRNMKEKSYFSDFVVLGTAKLIPENENEEVNYLQISIRFTEDRLELLFVDITKACLIEKSKAEVKFKSLYLAKIAHEFKNPMLAIISLCNSVANSGGNTQSSKDLNMRRKISFNFKTRSFIMGLCNYLLILIEDLNHFSRNELKKKDFRSSYECFDSFDLKEAMDFCVNIFKMRKESDGSKLNLKILNEYSKNLPKMNISETKLKQVIINLLSNSYKFTPSGHVKLIVKSNLDLEVERENSNYGFIRFMVEDTGLGISERDQKSLFSHFQNILEHKKYNTHGSGIGLRIVKEIVEIEFKSKIQFVSKIGKGTSFWFDIACFLGEENGKNNSSSLNSVNSQTDRTMKIVGGKMTISASSKRLMRPPIKGSFSVERSSFEVNSDYGEDEFSPIRSESGKNVILVKSPTSQFTDPIDKITDDVNFPFALENIKRRMNFLFCDDDDLVRKSIIKNVTKICEDEQIDLRIQESSNGIEALYEITKATIANESFDVIFIDETMPFMRGGICIKNIKAMIHDKQIPSLKICSITAYSDEEIVSSIKNQGADCIIMKPPTIKELKTFINSI